MKLWDIARQVKMKAASTEAASSQAPVKVEAAGSFRLGGKDASAKTVKKQINEAAAAPKKATTQRQPKAMPEKAKKPALFRGKEGTEAPSDNAPDHLNRAKKELDLAIQHDPDTTMHHRFMGNYHVQMTKHYENAGASKDASSKKKRLHANLAGMHAELANCCRVKKPKK